AQLWRETTWARIFVRRPSEASGKRSYSAFAIASSSTESPRNSSRSYDDARSGAHDVCVNTWSRRSGGRASIRRASATPSPGRSRLLVRDDVVDSLADGRDLLRVLVRDLDSELVFELHDQLDQVEGVGVEILLERRLVRELVFVYAELLAEDGLDALGHFFTGQCHYFNLSFVPTGSWSATTLPRAPAETHTSGRLRRARFPGLRGGSRSRSRRGSWSRARSRRGRAGR